MKEIMQNIPEKTQRLRCLVLLKASSFQSKKFKNMKLKINAESNTFSFEERKTMDHFSLLICAFHFCYLILLTSESSAPF